MFSCFFPWGRWVESDAMQMIFLTVIHNILYCASSFNPPPFKEGKKKKKRKKKWSWQLGSCISPRRVAIKVGKNTHIQVKWTSFAAFPEPSYLFPSKPSILTLDSLKPSVIIVVKFQTNGAWAHVNNYTHQAQPQWTLHLQATYKSNILLSQLKYPFLKESFMS